MLATFKEKPEEVLNVIWTCREGPDSEVIGTTNGHNLYIVDLKTLKPETELNDQIINCYLRLVTKKVDQVKKMVLCIDSFVLTDLTLKPKKKVSWLTKDELEKYDFAVGCVNENAVHWIAIIFDIRSKCIIIMDPLEEEQMLPRKQRAIEKCFNLFSKEKGMGTWAAQMARNYPIQQDGTSCGVFCLKFIERHLLQEDTNIPVNVNSERVDIGKNLILSLQPKPFLSCYVCIQIPFNLRRCCKCMRTFHKDCKIQVTCTVCCHLNTSKTIKALG
ncbi:sentrin-specific protease-like [Mytilus edulis]|uniref:sentrin-specific protease-like n=1 Tax=Mytilus edulis TaxID=6550 RepID=UPI0039F00D59